MTLLSTILKEIRDQVPDLALCRLAKDTLDSDQAANPSSGTYQLVGLVQSLPTQSHNTFIYKMNIIKFKELSRR